MVAMAKVFLLLLVVLKATALENSLESDSYHELFPLSSLPPSSPLAPYASQELDSALPPVVVSPPPRVLVSPPPPVVVSPPPPVVVPPPPPPKDRGAIARALCIAQCGISCLKKKSFLIEICLGICAAKCVISPTDSLLDITCTVDCVQSSTSSLRYDASITEDRLSSCYQQCERS